MKHYILVLAFVVLLLTGVHAIAQPDKSLGEYSDFINGLREAIKSGKIACHRTEPHEIIALLGEPQADDYKNDGNMARLTLHYPGVKIHFSRFTIYRDDPLILRSITIRGARVSIGGEGSPVLKDANDLRKLEDLHDVSLKNLDLTGQSNYLQSLNFDTSTVWPASDRLPPGFNPPRLLQEGRNPGLGIRSLHDEGIDGDGIGIAILDQPLIVHEEYSSRLVRYDASRSGWMRLNPQMHGSPIVSVAVGKTCGVAPGAFVFYYAGMTSSVHEIQADWIYEIIKHNETVGDQDRIRVISISDSPEDAPDNSAFCKARKKAHEAGILVVTCSDHFLSFGTLKLIEGKDPDNPENYIRGKYGRGNNTLLIPAGNKTMASYRGINTYIFEREDGKSWAAPYIAGLAALAFQVNPDVQPQMIVEQLVKTVTQAKIGPVVNPRKFIESIKGCANAKVEPERTTSETKSVNIVEISEISAVDRSSPEATVRNWIKAVAMGDVKDALACMLPDRADYVRKILNAEPSSGKYAVKKLWQSIDVKKPMRIRLKQLTEDEASIEFEFYFKEDVTIEWRSYERGESLKHDASLEKHGDYWLIDHFK
jgi:serine protease AprX